MEKTLSLGIKRGFTEEKLRKTHEPKVKKDTEGYYLYTVNEGTKVYFEDFYTFLEGVEQRSLKELKGLKEGIQCCDEKREESRAYYYARKVIVEVVLKNVYGYYGDDSSFGVIMTPWCFGTVILEKIENYKERLSRGELPDVNLPETPYLILRYIDEIYKKTILDLFELPLEAFSIKWQYTDLLKRFGRVFSHACTNLADILALIKEYDPDPSDQLA
ncbi:MAG: hypothetical protein JSV10_00970 [Candidatus Zixiibacteriota bacterium]|nr:MAG: hypothetical protein JSV10_00970 [candidate division Zixibacteria bacterium]